MVLPRIDNISYLFQVNFKYLSPLIKALEDQAASKAQELNSLKVSCTLSTTSMFHIDRVFVTWLFAL